MRLSVYCGCLRHKLGMAADEILFSMDALAELDLTLAKARYADALFATMPELLPAADRTVRQRREHRNTSMQLSV